MINLIPYAGLGNRIRVVASFYRFAKENNLQLKVYWMREPGFNCSFFTLFENPKDIIIDDHSWLNHFLYNKPTWRNLYIPIVFNKVLHRKFYYDLFKDTLDDSIVCDDPYITSYCQQGDMYDVKSLFKPAAHVQARIDYVKAKFSANTYGIHIRRSDNKQAKDKSKLDMFEEVMHNIIMSEPDASFFLCTDDIQTKEYLKNKFQERIITYNSVLNRSSKQGIVDAVVELWSLASTKEILGSYYSSYSDMAAQINGIKLKVIGVDEF